MEDCLKRKPKHLKSLQDRDRYSDKTTFYTDGPKGCMLENSSNKLKNLPVFQVLLGSGKGGIELLMPKVITALGTRSLGVYVVKGKAEGGDCVFYGTNIPVKKGGTTLLSSVWDLIRFVRTNKEAIFHGYNLGPLYLAVLWLAGATRIVYSIRGTLYWKNPLKRIPLKLAWRLALQKKPIFVSNSDYSARVFLEKIDSSAMVQTIYNPIEISDPVGDNKRETLWQDSIHIIYVGRLAKGKNLELWLELAHHLLHSFVNIRFTLYGKGPLQNELMERAEKLGLGNKVHFAGFVDDVVAAYQGADLLLFLSQYESFGNVVVESILAGTPVICSDILSLREIFSKHPHFLLDLDGDIHHEVEKKIKRLDVLRVQAKNAREEFRERFSMENHIKKIQDIYDSFQS